MALKTLGCNDNNLAVLHFSYEFGAYDVERTRLGGEDVGRAEAADDQRTDADGITRADQHVVGQTDEGVGTFQLAQGLNEPLDDPPFLRAGNKVKDDFRVGGRLENCARLDKLAAERQGVGEIAVMGDGEASGFKIGEQRLDVAEDRFAGG